DGYNEETINGPLYELDGKFQIYVQHYLFAETTLDLREPSVREVRFESKSTDQLNDELGDVDGNVQVGNLAEISPTVTEETFLKSYRLDQKRRMKSSETHYLDNPLMGMIIQVRRVN
ncbi:CsiV family protein, partial [Vibrio sp. 665]